MVLQFQGAVKKVPIYASFQQCHGSVYMRKFSLVNGCDNQYYLLHMLAKNGE